MQLTNSQPLVLASASPRRQEFLRQLGLTFQVVASGIEEIGIPGENPRNHVMRLAHEKSLQVARSYRDSWVLGADTVVVIGNEVLGKPENCDEARTMLKKLSGCLHTVITGFCLVQENLRTVITEAVESSVLFKTIPDDEIEWYIRTEEPYDKAGAYAVQGKAAFFIKEIQGSYSNVIGLPLCEVVTALKRVGAITFRSSCILK